MSLAASRERWARCRSFLAVSPPCDHRQRLRDQLVEDLNRTLLARDQTNALAGHQRTSFDIAVDHCPAQRSGPEMLDLELRILLRQFSARETLDYSALYRREPLGRRVGKRAHRDHRKTGVELHRRHGIAGRSADKRTLEIGVRD